MSPQAIRLLTRFVTWLMVLPPLLGLFAIIFPSGDPGTRALAHWAEWNFYKFRVLLASALLLAISPSMIQSSRLEYGSLVWLMRGAGVMCAVGALFLLVVVVFGGSRRRKKR